MATSESYEEEFDYEAEAFEYDDGDEAFEDDDDEAFEDDDDESFEDDDDESFEDDDDESFEDDDDEAFEEDDDEAFEEDDDEAVESDEAMPERSRSARLRARRRAQAQAKARAQARRRAAIARQRLAAKRARSSASRLQRRLKHIARMRKLKLKRMGRVRGSGVVTAQLPNGRRTKMKISPAPASLVMVNKLSARINANNRSQAKINAANSRSLKGLAAAQSAAIKKLTANQVKSSKMLSDRIVKGDNQLQKALAKVASSQKTALAKHRRSTMAMMRRNRQRSIWNGVLLATSMPMFAAYGDRNNPLGRKNVTMALSVLGWMLVDEYLLDQFFSRGKSAKTWGRIAGGWSFLAPVGNAVTVYLFMRNEQHLRFVTGTADASAGVGGTANSKVIDLADKVAQKYDKANFGPAQATIVSGPEGTVSVDAAVSDGKLTLTARDGTGAAAEWGDLKVAWVVDTGAPKSAFA